MNKKYTINNIEVTAEQIKDIIKNNPELLEEKKVSGRYFFPKKGEEYFDIDYNNIPYSYINKEMPFDKYSIEIGVYGTKEDARLALKKQKAIVACWKWAEENAPFEPDWEDGYQYKYDVFYDHFTREFYYASSFNRQYQFTLPSFKTRQDCENFIEANKANLELLFTK